MNKETVTSPRKDEWTKVVGEQADGLQLACYGSDGSDDVDGCDGVVAPSGDGIKMVLFFGLQKIGTFLRTSLRMTNT